MKHFELIERLASPSFMVLVGLRPLRGTMLVVIDAPLVVATVESRFGGNGRFPVTKAQRDFTTVEHKVMSRVTEIILEQFAGAWQRVADLQPEILRYEFNPQFVGITAAGEPVVTTTFQFKVDNGEGTLMIAIPAAMLGPIHEQLMSAVASDTAEPDGHWFEQLKAGIEQVTVAAAGRAGGNRNVGQRPTGPQPGRRIRDRATAKCRHRGRRRAAVSRTLGPFRG